MVGIIKLLKNITSMLNVQEFRQRFISTTILSFLFFSLISSNARLTISRLIEPSEFIGVGTATNIKSQSNTSSIVILYL